MMKILAKSASSSLFQCITGAIGVIIFSLSVSTPALAHHALGGQLPGNGWEGFVSGLAHPVIGFDHFAFVVAVGLLAATKRQGIGLPIAFVLAALAGTGLHLLSLNLPVPEIFVSVSVLAFGVMLAMQRSPNVLILLGLSAGAGLFHGYAYGESIVGAELSPLFAYLLGFTAIQIVVASGAYFVGKLVLRQSNSLGLRYMGFVLCGAGAAFLSAAILG